MNRRLQRIDAMRVERVNQDSKAVDIGKMKLSAELDTTRGELTL